MNFADVIAALAIPPSAFGNLRVPKKLLAEKGAPAAADKRRINDGIEEVSWLASLKPTTIGVPEFCDGTREYLEIAVLNVVLRDSAQTARLAALVHRAIPYPVLLIAVHGDDLSVSLAHKRRSQGEAGATVLDGGLVIVDSITAFNADAVTTFMNKMGITRQPCAHLFALYQGWVDTVVTLLATRVTGAFKMASSPQLAADRRMALGEYENLEAQLSALLRAGAKERQVTRKVALNLEVQRIRAAIQETCGRLRRLTSARTETPVF